MAVLYTERPPHVCWSAPPPPTSPPGKKKKKKTHICGIHHQWSDFPLSFSCWTKMGHKHKHPAVVACHISDATGMLTLWCWISPASTAPSRAQSDYGFPRFRGQLLMGRACTAALFFWALGYLNNVNLWLFVCCVKVTEPVTLSPPARCKQCMQEVNWKVWNVWRWVVGVNAFWLLSLCATGTTWQLVHGVTLHLWQQEIGSHRSP